MRAFVASVSISRGWSRREKISFAQAFGCQFPFGNQSSGAGVHHFLRVAQLMAVGGASERNEDRGAARGGYFRDGDRSCAANDHIGPGKAFRHVAEERDNFRAIPCCSVGGLHHIIVALAGLMHDLQLVFSRRKKLHRIDERAIDRQRALAPAGNQQTQRLFRLARLDREKFFAHGTSGYHGFFAPGLADTS